MQFYAKETILEENGYKVYLKPFDEIALLTQLLNGGYGNGYVTVPKNHPYYGLDEFDDRVMDLEVHGGVTFAAETEDGWTFGFDTLHYGDNPDNCTREYCINEALDLYTQLKQIEENNK